MADEVSERGKMIAALAYGGFFLGFPLGIIPLVMRDDPFALQHGKHATATWLLHFTMVMVLSFVVTVIATVTCGFGAILYPLVLVPALAGMGTSIHGLILALQGDATEPFGAMGLGDMLFSGIQLDEAAYAKLMATSAASAPAAAPATADEPPAAAAEPSEAPVEPADMVTDDGGDASPPPVPPASGATAAEPAADAPAPPPPASGATAGPPVDVPPPPPPLPPVDASDAPPPPPPLPPKSE